MPLESKGFDVVKRLLRGLIWWHSAAGTSTTAASSTRGCKVIRLSEIQGQMKYVDDPDVLEMMKDNPELEMALELTRPRNWWGTGLTPSPLLRIAREDGIAVAWLPNAELLKEIAHAKDSAERNLVLANKKDEILKDCQQALAECSSPQIRDGVDLANHAINAFSDGHVEAAMALAVSVAEPAAIWASRPRVATYTSRAESEKWRKIYINEKGRYGWARREYGRAARDLTDYEVARQAVIAPVAKFFTPWYARKRKPLPESLSRHVVAHSASASHYSPANSVKSLMLACSLLRDQQDWAEEMQIMDNEQ